MKKKRFQPPAVCPVCGEDVPPKSLACPECGADERSGWKEDAHSYDGLDIPDDEFDYEDFTSREFGIGKPKRNKERLLWLLVGLGLVAALLWGIFAATPR